MTIHDLETPALVIDLDIFERNLKRVADYASEHDLRLRPHTKTHKIPEIGRMQIESGAAGLTVAKVGEAEVMLDSGTPDLLVAYPIIGRSKLERLAQVARRTNVTVALDSLFAARQLSDVARQMQVSFGVLAEVDAGLGRVGVTLEELPALIQGIGRLPRLTFEGVNFYPGHIKRMDESADAALETLSAFVNEIRDCLKRDGIEAKIISGGSTPTLFRSHEVAGVNEIRPGTYVFNDRNTVSCGACEWSDCAASILTTVVSTAKPGQMIIDGGSKTFSSDRLAGSTEVTFGYLVDAPGASFFTMNEEHGYVDMRKAEREFEVGDRVRVIPNHICVAVNLHERIYGVRNGNVEKTWEVAGRGKLQ